MKLKKEKDFKFTIFNEKVCMIFTILLYIMIIASYELLFCNGKFVLSIIQKTESVAYNFSVLRIVAYLMVAIIYFVFRKKLLEQAMNSFQYKMKKVMIVLYAIIFIICSIILLTPEKHLIIQTLGLYFILLAMAGIVILYLSTDLAKNAIIISFCLGFVFSISVEYYHALDEKKHFMSAYNVAFGNFDFSEPITDKQLDNIPHRSPYSIIENLYEMRYHPEIIKNENLGDVSSTPATYSTILYIPAAIGICLARLLPCSIADLYVTGRLFNLIAYTLLITLALKIVPIKKKTFFTIFLIPMAVMLGASYSIDGMCIAFVSIFIAYCLKLYHQSEPINMKQILILLATFVLVALSKSMGYIAVGFLIFILPIAQIMKNNKKYLPYFIGGIIVIAFLGIFAVTKIELHSDPRGGNTSISQQIQFIINNPTAIFIILGEHLKGTHFSYHWLTYLNQNVFFGDLYSCIFLVLFCYILYVAVLDTSKNFKIKEKVILLITYFLVFGMTSAVLYVGYTPVGALSIGGYQTRYILPIVVLPLMCLSSKKIERGIDEEEKEKFKMAFVSAAIIIIDLICLIHI